MLSVAERFKLREPTTSTPPTTAEVEENFSRASAVFFTLSPEEQAEFAAKNGDTILMLADQIEEASEKTDKVNDGADIIPPLPPLPPNIVAFVKTIETLKAQQEELAPYLAALALESSTKNPVARSFQHSQRTNRRHKRR